MAAQGGFGLGLTHKGTTVISIDSVDELQFTKFMAEVTSHDSPGGYYEAVATGKRRIQPLAVGAFWDSAAATHTAVLAAFDADTEDEWVWSDPDGDESIAVKMHVEQIGRISEQEDAYRANILLHPTGTATIT